MSSMVMDVYRSVVPKPPDSVYILEKQLDSDKYEPLSLLGVFDELETALHALDLTSKYKSHSMRKATHCLSPESRRTLS